MWLIFPDTVSATQNKMANDVSKEMVGRNCFWDNHNQLLPAATFPSTNKERKSLPCLNIAALLQKADYFSGPFDES